MSQIFAPIKVYLPKTWLWRKQCSIISYRCEKGCALFVPGPIPGLMLPYIKTAAHTDVNLEKKKMSALNLPVEKSNLVESIALTSDLQFEANIFSKCLLKDKKSSNSLNLDFWTRFMSNIKHFLFSTRIIRTAFTAFSSLITLNMSY